MSENSTYKKALTMHCRGQAMRAKKKEGAQRPIRTCVAGCGNPALIWPP